MEDHMELNHISHSKAKFYPKVLVLKLYLERLDFKPDCTNIACFEANHETMCSFVLMLVLMHDYMHKDSLNVKFSKTQ